MSKLLKILTSLLTLNPALAQDRPPGPERGKGSPRHRPDSSEFIKRFDLDDDGKLSRSEFDKGERVSELEEEIRDKIFSRLDKDGDGFITKVDLKKIPPPKEDPHDIRRADKDKDGRISFEEFSESPRINKLPEERQKEMFARFDRNGDGFLDPGDRRDDDSRKRDHDHHRPMPPIKMEGLDADKNGTLSWAEFQNAPGVIAMEGKDRRRLFDWLDGDHDGELSTKELKGPPRDEEREGKGRERPRKGPGPKK